MLGGSHEGLGGGKAVAAEHQMNPQQSALHQRLEVMDPTDHGPVSAKDDRGGPRRSVHCAASFLKIYNQAAATAAATCSRIKTAAASKIRGKRLSNKHLIFLEDKAGT